MANILQATQDARIIYKPKPQSWPALQSLPTQEQPTTQDDVKMEESSNTKNVHHFGLINTEMRNSPGMESAMARATPMWGNINKKDGGNKRKKSWDELIAEDEEKGQAEILATELEWSLKMISQEKKIKKA